MSNANTAASAADLLAFSVSFGMGETSNPLIPLLIIAVVIILVLRWAS